MEPSDLICFLLAGTGRLQPRAAELASQHHLADGDPAGAGPRHPQCGLDHPGGPGAPGARREDPAGPHHLREVQTKQPECQLDHGVRPLLDE